MITDRVYDSKERVHIYPVMDSIEHCLEGILCPCGVTLLADGTVVEHKRVEQTDDNGADETK